MIVELLYSDDSFYLLSSHVQRLFLLLDRRKLDVLLVGGSLSFLCRAHRSAECLSRGRLAELAAASAPDLLCYVCSVLTTCAVSCSK